MMIITKCWLLLTVKKSWRRDCISIQIWISSYDHHHFQQVQITIKQLKRAVEETTYIFSHSRISIIIHPLRYISYFPAQSIVRWKFGYSFPISHHIFINILSFFFPLSFFLFKPLEETGLTYIHNGVQGVCTHESRASASRHTDRQAESNGCGGGGGKKTTGQKCYH